MACVFYFFCFVLQSLPLFIDLCVGTKPGTVPNGSLSVSLLLSKPPRRGIAKSKNTACLCKSSNEGCNGSPWNLFSVFFSCTGELKLMPKVIATKIEITGSFYKKLKGAQLLYNLISHLSFQ